MNKPATNISTNHTPSCPSKSPINKDLSPVEQKVEEVANEKFESYPKTMERPALNSPISIAANKLEGSSVQEISDIQRCAQQSLQIKEASSLIQTDLSHILHPVKSELIKTFMQLSPPQISKNLMYEETAKNIHILTTPSTHEGRSLECLEDVLEIGNERIVLMGFSQSTRKGPDALAAKTTELFSEKLHQALSKTKSVSDLTKEDRLKLVERVVMQLHKQLQASAAQMTINFNIVFPADQKIAHVINVCAGTSTTLISNENTALIIAAQKQSALGHHELFGVQIHSFFVPEGAVVMTASDLFNVHPEEMKAIVCSSFIKNKDEIELASKSCFAHLTRGELSHHDGTALVFYKIDGLDIS